MRPPEAGSKRKEWILKFVAIGVAVLFLGAGLLGGISEILF